MTSPADHPDWDDAVVVALGSNLGESRAVLERALRSLDQAGLTVRARSGWWRSTAWPDSADPDFLNGVALVATDRPPEEVLDVLLQIERESGRVRSVANAPRTLDLDLIAYGRLVRAGAALTLPHPRAQDRLFVMGPLAEIAPAWRHPVTDETAEALARSAAQGRDAAPVS
jgi:2-amino-4-hydroxy-6-hydroxymethyldihydropteridine diphosphokinase